MGCSGLQKKERKKERNTTDREGKNSYELLN
jgi:hypothetical protein